MQRFGPTAALAEILALAALVLTACGGPHPSDAAPTADPSPSPSTTPGPTAHGPSRPAPTPSQSVSSGASWRTELADAPTSTPRTPRPSSLPSPTPSSTPHPFPTTCPLPDQIRESQLSSIYSALWQALPFSGDPVLVWEGTALDQWELDMVAAMANEHWDDFAGFLPDLTPELMADFLWANSRPVGALDLRLPPRQEILTAEMKNSLFGDYSDLEQGWENFEIRFPHADGWWEFSHSGFTCDLQTALVFVRHAYGAAGMTGTFYLVKYTYDRWQIESEFLYSES